MADNTPPKKKPPSKKGRYPGKPGQKTKPNGERFPSSTGKKKPNVDTTNWRRKVQERRIKFDDDQKLIYLQALASHGMKGRAADAAAVSQRTVKTHLEDDPEFAEAYDDAVDAYRDKFVDHAMTLAYDGIEVKKFNKDGDLIEERRDYPVRLIELELKRVEPGYRDKQSVDMNHTGGVMLAPAEMTPAEWIAQQKQLAEDKE